MLVGHDTPALLGQEKGMMMMHEDEPPPPAILEKLGGRAVLDLPLLSRDDATWTQFNGAEGVAETALRGEWSNCHTRGLLWRLLLGVIPKQAPPSQWAQLMSSKRDEYARLKADHRVDIAKVVDTTDPMSANPLFSGTGSGNDPWSHFYELKEMTDTIKADLERLYPTGCGDHFLAPARQELLLSVLSLWADIHPETRYRQGMHEVLAPLILALEKEVAAATRAAPTSSASSSAPTVESSVWLGSATVNGAPMKASAHPGAAATLGSGSSPEDLEADAFWLFSAVMTGLEGFYEHGASHSDRRQSGGSDSDGLDSPVVEMCKRLQGPRMHEADPEVQRHLADLDISPQLYGMKWARLMFGREFRVEHVMLLWDHMFASSWLGGRPDLPECIEVVAVAMVLSIREELLGEDCTGCLQLLMRFPPDQSVSMVINLSLLLGQPGGYKPTRPVANGPAPHMVAPSDKAGRPLPAPTESGPTWLMDSGRASGDPGIASVRGPSGSGSSHSMERRRGGAVDSGGARSASGAGFGREGEIEGRGDAKNNWQHGLDEFTRRAFTVAQDMAKMAVQTVERTQGSGDARPRQEGVSASEAQSLARRLRVACAAMEVGETSPNMGMQEIKEVARILEGSRGGHSGTISDSRAPRRNDAMGGGGGGKGVTRGFSTYSEDDGCADGLYTRDL